MCICAKMGISVDLKLGMTEQYETLCKQFHRVTLNTDHQAFLHCALVQPDMECLPLYHVLCKYRHLIKATSDCNLEVTSKPVLPHVCLEYMRQEEV